MSRLGFFKSEQNRVEIMVLLIFSFFGGCYSLIMLEKEQISLKVIVVILAIVYSVFCYIAQVRTFKFRAMSTSAMIVLSGVVYAYSTPDFFSIEATFISFIVLMALYGIEQVMYISLIGTTLLVFMHSGIFVKTNWMDFKTAIITIVQVSSVYWVQLVVYYYIRKQNQIQETMQESIRELQAAKNAKDDFLANISHEIRTPINTIYGLSEMMLQEELDLSTKEKVRSVKNAGRNLLSIVSDVLDYSELESRKMEVVEEEYNVVDTIYEIINIGLGSKTDNKIEYIVNVDATMPSVLVGDEQKIRRVLTNIINNAFKFTTEGCINIKVGYRKEEYGINLLFSVSDTGIGIDQKNQETLFTTFSQVDGSRNRRKGGIGLGLAISQALVETMGGFISVKSEIGMGCCVQFVVPQKVASEIPITKIENQNPINIMTYIDMEQFELLEVRAAYLECIVSMVEQLNISCHMCRTLDELKRRLEKEKYTNIFISYVEYFQDSLYFDKLAKEYAVTLVLDEDQVAKIPNPDFNHIIKPINVLAVAKVLNGDVKKKQEHKDVFKEKRFVAPECHVLAIDDNEMNLKVLEGLLDTYKIQVTTALSGMEGLELLEEKKYDLVFLDHMMPEMDGVETLKRIRKKSGNYYKQIPIVAVTANAVSGSREMLLSEGFDEFISKPVDVSVLERVLKRMLPANKLLSEVGKAEEKNAIVPEKKEETTVAGLDLEDIDVQKGIMYCGTEKNYIEVLQMHYKNGLENLDKLEGFVESKDWRNYTILIHAVKSSMMSIGAVKLSEMAKKLEAAGKEDRISYIEENHAEMMEEYRRIIAILSRNERVNPSANAKEEPLFEALAKGELDMFIKQYEDAVYSFDYTNMLDIISLYMDKSWEGQNLNPILEKMKQKVEMSDYMSSLEVLKRLKGK